MFVLGGIRYDFDLSAKSSRRNADDQILLQTHDVSFETGFGFQFYLPYVILSPEFKVSHGLINRKFPNENLIYSRAIDKLFSRMFTISINLEGVMPYVLEHDLASGWRALWELKRNRRLLPRFRCLEQRGPQRLAQMENPARRMQMVSYPIYIEGQTRCNNSVNKNKQGKPQLDQGFISLSHSKEVPPWSLIKTMKWV